MQEYAREKKHYDFVQYKVSKYLKNACLVIISNG